MIYTDGDSFGFATGKGEVLWVFEDIESARLAQRMLEENKKEFSIKFEDGKGNTIQFSNPGAGYFESVENISIDSYFVKTI